MSETVSEKGLGREPAGEVSAPGPGLPSFPVAELNNWSAQATSQNLHPSYSSYRLAELCAGCPVALSSTCLGGGVLIQQKLDTFPSANSPSEKERQIYSDFIFRECKKSCRCSLSPFKFSSLVNSLQCNTICWCYDCRAIVIGGKRNKVL